MSDSWLMQYNVCIALGQDIIEAIVDRNRETYCSTAYNKKSAAIRLKVARFSTDVKSLEKEFSQAALQSNLTSAERDRRRVKLTDLLTKQKQIELALRQDHHPTASVGMATTSGFADSHWGSGGYEQDDNLTVDEIRSRQQQLIAEQDRGLDSLAEVISKQKHVALEIGNEVEGQNELLDDITDHMDTTRQRLINETRHVERVDRKSRTCVYWLIIIGLLIVIIIIIAIPF